MTSFSSQSEEAAVTSAARVLAMFCRWRIGVYDPPYKLDEPATDTLCSLGSLVLGQRWGSVLPIHAGNWGSVVAEHPSMPWSFMSISVILEPPIPLSWDSTPVLSKRGVVSRIGKPGALEYSLSYAKRVEPPDRGSNHEGPTSTLIYSFKYSPRPIPALSS